MKLKSASNMLEFQAVVMAGGRGSRLPDVPGAPPKCLLPVGPFPLVWYPLNLLERQGFKEVMMLVLETEKVDIQNAIDKCNIKLKIEYISIPFDKDWGTAQSLRHINDRLVTDVLVMSCDFITDSNLDSVLDLFRKHDASIVSLLFDKGPQEFIQVPGPKCKDKPERDLIGIDEETQRLVFLASASDFDETVDLPRVLLKKHPVLSIRSRLLDSHVYVLKKWIVDFLKDEDRFTTIKGELLPYIIKKQSSRPAVASLDDKNVSVAGINMVQDIYQYANLDGLDEMIKESSTYNDHSGGMKGCYHGDRIRCYAHIPPPHNYAIRVNTLSAYCLINSKIIAKWETITKGTTLSKIHPNSNVKSKKIQNDSIVGDQSTINEKTSIKCSMIGSHCIIENKVRLTNCVLMNNVTIKEGCVLQDCIIYSDATLEPECTLKLCIVGPHHKIDPKTDGQLQIYSETSDNMITLG